jgi:hypothetical protein
LQAVGSGSLELKGTIMATILHPHITASQDAIDARELARIMLFAAESCEDVEYGRLRHTHITLLYIILDKLDEAGSCIEQLYQPEKGPLQ